MLATIGSGAAVLTLLWMVWETIKYPFVKHEPGDSWLRIMGSCLLGLIFWITLMFVGLFIEAYNTTIMLQS